MPMLLTGKKCKYQNNECSMCLFWKIKVIQGLLYVCIRVTVPSKKTIKIYPKCWQKLSAKMGVRFAERKRRKFPFLLHFHLSHLDLKKKNYSEHRVVLEYKKKKRVKTWNLLSKVCFIITKHLGMTSQADEAGARLPKGVKDPCRRVGRTKLLQTNNYPSWSLSQEVTSITSLNNSLQGLITFPCRKFFLSSQLSPSCCPVSPNGCVSFPSPLSAVRNKDRIPWIFWSVPSASCPNDALRTLARQWP